MLLLVKLKEALMMIRTAMFILIIYFISGCGVMGSSSKKDDTASASAELDTEASATAELNVTSELEGSQLAVAEEDMASTNEITADEDEPPIKGGIVVEEESILPKAISMDFPKVLKKSSETNETNQSTAINNKIGYTQLKQDIFEVEEILNIAEVNLVVLEEVMPEVLLRCEGMISCTFENRSLSFIMNDKVIDSLDSISDDNKSFKDLNNTRVFLGELTYTKNDSSLDYQYSLIFDINSETSVKANSKTIKIFQFQKESVAVKSKKEFQTLNWSDNSKDVITSYLYEDNKTSFSVSVHYLTDEEGVEMMHVYDKHDTVDGHKENMSLTLTASDEGNNSFTLRTNSIEAFTEGNETNVSSFSTNAEISEENTLLLFSGKVSNETIGTEVGAISEVVCENNESCDENGTEVLSRADSIELYELEIKGGNLEDGSYILLPPSSNIDDLELIDIFELSLGTFTVFDGKRQGEIHDNSYANMLNQLKILKILEYQESEQFVAVVKSDDKPTLKFVKY